MSSWIQMQNLYIRGVCKMQKKKKGLKVQEWKRSIEIKAKPKQWNKKQRNKAYASAWHGIRAK